MKRSYMFLPTVQQEKDYLDEWVPERANLEDASIIVCALKQYDGLELFRSKLSTTDDVLIKNKLKELLDSNTYLNNMNKPVDTLNAIRLKILANAMLALKCTLKEDWVKFANVYGILLVLEILPVLLENGKEKLDLSQKCFEQQLKHIEPNMFKKAFEEKISLIDFSNSLNLKLKTLSSSCVNSKTEQMEG